MKQAETLSSKNEKRYHNNLCIKVIEIQRSDEIKPKYLSLAYLFARVRKGVDACPFL